MKYDWITIAIENGGVLTTSKNVHGIASTMHWKGQEPICGERHTTLPDAITSLNSALEDDVAEECCPSNVRPLAPADTQTLKQNGTF